MQVILHENVLTDDFLEGTTLHYFTFANEWSDREHIEEFKTVDDAIEWYRNNFRDRVVHQGQYWYCEGLDEGEEIVPDDVCETDAIDAWDMFVADVVAYWD